MGHGKFKKVSTLGFECNPRFNPVNVLLLQIIFIQVKYFNILYITINIPPVKKSEKNVWMKSETKFPLRCMWTLKLKHMVHPRPIKSSITAI